MDVILIPLLTILGIALKLYVWVIIIAVVMSWLINFKVINTSNQFVMMVLDVTYRLTEPLLSKIRRFMPNFGGVDLSPVVLILGIWFLEMVLAMLAGKLMGVNV